MNLGSTAQQSVGILEIHLDGDDIHSAAEERKVSRFLDNGDLKAAVLMLKSDIPSAAAKRLFPSLKSTLADATIPLAAVYRTDAGDAVRSLAETCLFQYTATDDSIKTAVSEAAARLHTLTDKRPNHVIYAVMKSLCNAETMSEEDALFEETKLFCALSLKNRETIEDAVP